MKQYKNKHFSFNLRIRKYYKFGILPFYRIEKRVNARWFSVLDLPNCDLKLAKGIKSFLIKNPDLITNPFEVKKISANS